MCLQRVRFLEIVRAVPDSEESQKLAARFAVVDVSDGSTYDVPQDDFRFRFAENIDPTDNHSEQQVRHVVIDRRSTQGTRSDSGQRYQERMWTATATRKKQNKSFFTSLHESIQAEGGNPPQASSHNTTENGYEISYLPGLAARLEFRQMLGRSDEPVPVFVDVLWRSANLCDDLSDLLGWDHFDRIPWANEQFVRIGLLLRDVYADFASNAPLEINFTPALDPLDPHISVIQVDAVDRTDFSARLASGAVVRVDDG